MVCFNPSRIGIFALANFPIAIRREPSTNSVLTPSFSHLPISAADSAKPNPICRSGAPYCTSICPRRSRLIPVFCEALNMRSSVLLALAASMPQSPITRASPRTMISGSTFIIALAWTIFSAVRSSSVPVIPKRVFRSAITADICPSSPGARAATSRSESCNPASASPAWPVRTAMASIASSAASAMVTAAVPTAANATAKACDASFAFSKVCVSFFSAALSSLRNCSVRATRLTIIVPGDAMLIAYLF
ncbi:MAG: hypothetical protein DDT20_01861 [Firmicutes bacterium]|nr:hypothetical protein [Bacillota bacterium]